MIRRVDVSMLSSRTRPPVGQQRQHVEDADGAVTIEVGRPTGIAAPRREQRKQVEDADGAVAVEARILGIVEGVATMQQDR